MTRDAASSLRPGPEPSLFKSKHHCIRLHYLVNGQGGYFHMFRSTGTRFFNNVAVAMSSEEETIGKDWCRLWPSNSARTLLVLQSP